FNVTGLSPSTSYNFTVFAEDAAGNVSAVSNTESVTTSGAPDTQAPSAVTDLTASGTTSTSTNLSWSASTDNVGVTNYEVFQNGVSIANTGTATNFNVTGLAPSSNYDFTVFAEDAAGNVSAVSNTESVTTSGAPDTQAPSAVTDLTASGTTSTSTNLSWSASTDNVGVTNYEVFQNGVSIANTGTATNFNVTGLAPSSNYDFTVFAEDAAGNVSAVSNTESVTTSGAPDTQAPSAVTDLTASGTTSTSTNLSWSASTDNVGVTNYEVFQNGVSIGNTGTATNFNVTGLSPSTSYNFTVFAEDAAGNVSAVSNTESVTTSGAPDTQAPSAVTDLTASGTTSTSTNLSWSASTDNVGVTNYEVFQNGVSIANTGTATNFNVTGLAPSSNYDFTVFAEDAAGNVSAVSNTESVTTSGAPDTQAPSAVTDLTASGTTSTSTNLSWSASTDNVGVTNYEVFQNGVSIANTGTATNFNVTGLAPSSNYDFTVFAEDAAGNVSAVSNTESVTTSGAPDTQAPSAVTDLTASGTTSTSTNLSWSASTDNVGVTNYEVFQNGVSIANTGTATNFNVTGLAPSSNYDFTVFAEDAAGNVSAVSNTESVTTSGAPDTQAPSAVTDLTASGTTSTSTNLSWSASTDNVGVTNYEVFQNGVSIGNTGTVTNFNVTGLSPSTSYNFTVFAEDAAGNVSAVSNTESVTTAGAPDTQAPSAVTDLTASGTTSTSTNLSWSASTDNVGVTNYAVFQNGVSIANTGTATNFNVTGLAPSTSYNFTVFAEDEIGRASCMPNDESTPTHGPPKHKTPGAGTRSIDLD